MRIIIIMRIPIRDDIVYIAILVERVRESRRDSYALLVLTSKIRDPIGDLILL